MAQRILVVDDDDLIRRSYLRGIRQRTGVRPLEASRAEEARLLIEADPSAEWILVLDHSMISREGDLVRNGLELVRYLQTKTTIQMKIVMTGSGVLPDVAIAGGMISLPKPFEIRVLIEQLQPWLETPPEIA